jgi:hypothetical protein
VHAVAFIVGSHVGMRVRCSGRAVPIFVSFVRRAVIVRVTSNPEPMLGRPTRRHHCVPLKDGIAVTRAVMVMDMVAIFTVVAVVTIGPYESREARALCPCP